jgi:hypothetical protein
MKLHKDLGERGIKEVIEEYPEIGNILDKYEIGCLACSIGTCLLKDVVTVHVLGDAAEGMIEKEINQYLEKLQ